MTAEYFIRIACDFRSRGCFLSVFVPSNRQKEARDRLASDLAWDTYKYRGKRYDICPHCDKELTIQGRRKLLIENLKELKGTRDV